MTNNIAKTIVELRNLEFRMKQGLISYDVAKALSQPLLAILNGQAREISKKHGRRFKPIGWTGFIR